MLTVGQTYDAVDTIVITHLGISLDGIDDGSRIGKARSFEEDGIKVLAARGKLPQGADEIPTYRAADAAVVHCDQVFWCIQRFCDCNSL